MNLANQQALIQAANMNLIGIRYIELSYFATFFANLGTQSALFIGFISGSLSQVPGTDNPAGCWYGWLVLYWVSSAVCYGAGVHALVCSVFLQVFGQGLGLRGPVGSMVRAVEGMIAEQENVLQAFLLAIFSFGFQCIGMYFIMMDSMSAIISSAFTLIAIFLWYRYALRLYNRFSWKNVNVAWDGKDDESEADERDDYATEPGHVQNALHQKQKSAAAEKSKQRKNRSEEEIKALEELVNVAKSESVPGGYLTLKLLNFFGGQPWQRRYFLVRGRLIFYYKDKRSFQLDPTKPINTRPIDMEGYTLIAGAREPPYSIALVPVDEDDNRKAWKFRCDTLSEFQRWIELFAAALKLTESGREQGDLVDMGAVGLAPAEDTSE